MSSSAGPSRVSRPRRSSAATSNGNTASSTGTEDGARTGGSEICGSDCEAMDDYVGANGVNRNPLTWPRVPDALQRSSRCCAEPGPYQTPEFVTAPALQRTATRCAASGE